MPKGPNGEKRPADAIGLAVMIGRIATGEIEDELTPSKGSLGGIQRAKKLSASERSAIAQTAARRRWQEVADAQD